MNPAAAAAGLLLLCCALGNDELDARAGRIRPTPEESRWMEIPWARSLGDARDTAARENRPIFVWAVDDDPLERC